MHINVTEELTGTHQPEASSNKGQQTTIGPNGGEVYGSGGARLVIPEGSLSEAVKIGLQEVQDPPSLPSGSASQSAGPAYEVSFPNGIELNKMVDIWLPLDMPAGVDPTAITVFRWDGIDWWDVGGIVEGDQIHIQLDHFSPTIVWPAIGVPRRPLGFRCQGSYDARIFTWTYWSPGDLILPSNAQVAVPRVALALSCDPMSSTRYMSLPYGAYQFCVEYYRDEDNWKYVYGSIEGVSESDPEQTFAARVVTIETPAIASTRGRCTVGGWLSYSTTRKPIRFRGMTGHNFNVYTFDYWAEWQLPEKRGIPMPATPRIFTTVTSAPGSSLQHGAMLLPYGLYTFCAEFQDGGQWWWYIDPQIYAIDDYSPDDVGVSRLVDLVGNPGVIDPEGQSSGSGRCPAWFLRSTVAGGGATPGGGAGWGGSGSTPTPTAHGPGGQYNLVLGGQDGSSYYLMIQGNKVVGGYIQDQYNWTITGGTFYEIQDGDVIGLTPGHTEDIVFTAETNELSGCESRATFKIGRGVLIPYLLWEVTNDCGTTEDPEKELMELSQ